MKSPFKPFLIFADINLITEFLYLTQNTFIETLEAKINKNHDKFTSLIKRELENNIYILETD